MVIDQARVSNRVSMDRVTKKRQGPAEATVGAPTRGAAGREPEHAAECVVEHLVDHRVTRSGTQYKVVRWYGYTRADDTWEPAEGLTQAFIDR